jgi:NAD+ kinase
VAPRIALVVKRSVWDREMERKDNRLHDLLERSDPTVAAFKVAHEEHAETVAEVKKALADHGAQVTRIRRTRERFDASSFDLVVTVGGDGTLLHASHSVADTPVLAINSAPTTSVGFFCGARKGQVAEKLAAALRGKLRCAALTRMQVALNGQIVSARVLNDALYCHQSPAVTSPYIVEHGPVTEEHMSSGFWIGPAAGSTAAQRSAGGEVLPLSSKKLQFVVREPYTPHGGAYRLAHVIVKNGTPVRVRSKSRRMRIFVDGPHELVRVDLGDVVDFVQSPEPLKLLGISVRRKWGT